MPYYTFQCDICGERQNHNMRIDSFQNKEWQDLICFVCRKKSLSRVYGKTFSNVQKSSAELLYEIKESVNKTVEKIENGDTHAIRDVYGEVE